MHQVRTVDRFSQSFLNVFYYYALFLGVINCRFDRTNHLLYAVGQRGKFIARFVRLIMMLIYIGALTQLFKQFEFNSLSHRSIPIAVFVVLQVVSVMIFAVFIFIVQSQCELQVIHLINAYLRLCQRILERCDSTNLVHGMLKRKFLLIVLLKLAMTLIGYVNEFPALLRDAATSGLIEFAETFVGVYLWMGSMLVLDCCVLGLLIVALMYEEMGNFLRGMLSRMDALEDTAEIEDGNKRMNKWRKLHLSKHKRMKLLCEYADIIADCDVIYAELYALMKKFQSLFQWQIFYYIYYNFMVTLLLFHNSIWVYLHSDVIDKLNLLMVAVKITNLVILILCADFVVQRFEMPKLLCLDVVCSDIDERWCTSVEAFLCHRQVESLEVKVLGFFPLNNEFILVILSAIVSYLFIIIQFGLTDIK